MRLILTAGAFADDAQHSLLQLLLFAVHGRHDILVHPSVEQGWQRWLRGRNETERSSFQRAVEDSHSRQRHESYLELHTPTQAVSSHPHQQVLGLAEAVALLDRPLEIWVEDSVSDGVFLDAVAPLPLREGWRRRVQADHLRYSNLGGKKQAIRRLSVLSSERRQRSYVIIDSDAVAPWKVAGEPARTCWPTLRRNDDEKATRDEAYAVDKMGVSVHVLWRRMNENYIPPAAIIRWAEALPQREHRKLLHAQAFSKLSPVQQHFHYMKGVMRYTPSQTPDLTDRERAVMCQKASKLGRKVYQAIEQATDEELQAYGTEDEMSELFGALLRRV